jgi:hypothetical protein
MHSIFDYNDILPFKPIDTKNLFLCYNRVRKKHRTLIVCELFASKLENRGLISYWNSDQQTKNLVIQYERDSDLFDAAGEIDNLRGLHLDYDLNITNPCNKINYDNHRATFLSLVTETLIEDELFFQEDEYDGNFPIFFTEKTYRPINIGQPFIILGTINHLKKLKEMGYKTFDKWWSEDYDQESDINKKISMIVEQLKMLSLLSAEELIKIREEMRPTLLHNQNILNDFRKKDSFVNEEPLYKTIKHIWDSF